MLIHVPLKTPFSCAIYQRKDPALRLSFPFCSFAKNPVASSGKGHPSRKNHSFSSMTVYKYKFIKETPHKQSNFYLAAVAKQ